MTLKTKLCGVTLKNPLIMASGTFGFGAEFAEYMDLSALGGICSKGLTLHPKQGNYGSRMWETPAGMMNSVGLQNPGVACFISDELPRMRRSGAAVIANLGGGTVEEYVEGARLLDSADIDLLELNISCPNVKEGGANFGIDPEVAAGVVSAVRGAFRGPMMVKLSPNAHDIVDMALACEAAGADALSLVNTFKAMAIDIHRRGPVFRNVSAGLSGPAIKPIALRMVYEVAGAVKVPVVGLGGIATATDALEFILAGAAAVQIGTASFVKPDIALDILAGIEEYMERNKVKDLRELRGAARL